MEILMIAVDIVVLMVMTSTLRFSLSFTKLSLRNKKAHNLDAVSQMHFHDHAIAVIFSLVGSSVGVLMAAFHILQQHILRVDTYWSEMGLAGSFVILACSGLLFMRHMICEETPGHPYYIREYLSSEDSIKIQLDQQN